MKLLSYLLLISQIFGIYSLTLQNSNQNDVNVNYNFVYEAQKLSPTGHLIWDKSTVQGDLTLKKFEIKNINVLQSGFVDTPDKVVHEANIKICNADGSSCVDNSIKNYKKPSACTFYIRSNYIENLSSCN